VFCGEQLRFGWLVSGSMDGLGYSDRLCGEQLPFGWSDNGLKGGLGCSDF
jgi:hypothetical protein